MKVDKNIAKINDFYISKYKVPVKETNLARHYKNLSLIIDDSKPDKYYYKNFLPSLCSYNEACNYLNQLSTKENLVLFYDNFSKNIKKSDLNGYRLPSNAEYEYLEALENKSQSSIFEYFPRKYITDTSYPQQAVNVSQAGLLGIHELFTNSLEIHSKSEDSDSKYNSEPYLLLDNTLYQLRNINNSNLAFRVARNNVSKDIKIMDNLNIKPSKEQHNKAIKVSISSKDKDADIYYTLNKSEPTKYSTKYTEPFPIYKSSTVKAKAFKDNCYPNDTCTKFYRFSYKAPEANIEPGIYDKPIKLEFSSVYDNAEIYYNTSSFRNNSRNRKYTSPIEISKNTNFYVTFTLDGYPTGVNTKFTYLFKDDIRNDNMVKVEGGFFLMGSEDIDSESDEQPVHRVMVNSFMICRHEVTVNEYNNIMAYYGFKDKSGSPMLAVCDVSWLNAIKFCNYKSQLAGYDQVYKITDNGVIFNKEANGYRLPPEAEWEYAARGGKKSKEYIYAGSNNIYSVAFYKYQLSRKTSFNYCPTIIMKYKPNELGLYDMSGNAYEWCYDFYSDKYNPSDNDNPSGPKSGKYHVSRGGCYFSKAKFCRVANRNDGSPSYKNLSIGFRLVRNAEK